ncbi:MAG TPA: DUF433 domain-containing protein [Methylomirabilota bacterium]|nr:DUF433 domain-containing protein [Methylomirabilota bacterium]
MIVRNARVQGGEPVIRGTRVPVRSVALARQEGLDPPAIAREFCLDLSAVQAALAYYEAHRKEIDRIVDLHEREAHSA